METLFDPGPREEPPQDESAQQRRTRRQRGLIAAGLNPATRMPLRGSETCGTCAHLINVGHGARHYWKCELVEVTHGPGSDARKWWPACVKWEKS